MSERVKMNAFPVSLMPNLWLSNLLFFPPFVKTETVNVVSHEQDKRPDELYAILRDFLHQVYFRYGKVVYKTHVIETGFPVGVIFLTFKKKIDLSIKCTFP